MDPIQAFPVFQANTAMQPSSNMFAPGIFFTIDEENNYLSALDSDTRDYVTKHPDDFRTREDLDDYTNKMHLKR